MTPHRTRWGWGVSSRELQVSTTERLSLQGVVEKGVTGTITLCLTDLKSQDPGHSVGVMASLEVDTVSQSSGQSPETCLSSTVALVNSPLSFLVAGVALQTPSAREALTGDPGGAYLQGHILSRLSGPLQSCWGAGMTA